MMKCVDEVKTVIVVPAPAKVDIAVRQGRYIVDLSGDLLGSLVVSTAAGFMSAWVLLLIPWGWVRCLPSAVITAAEELDVSHCVAGVLHCC